MDYIVQTVDHCSYVTGYRQHYISIALPSLHVLSKKVATILQCDMT